MQQNIPGDRSRQSVLLEGGPCIWSTSPHPHHYLLCALTALSATAAMAHQQGVCHLAMSVDPQYVLMNMQVYRTTWKQKKPTNAVRGCQGTGWVDISL